MSHKHSDNKVVEEREPVFNTMQRVKRRFFAMRNGALAAQMRAGGVAYQINFGLNIPQIREIADEVIRMGLPSAELLGLADALWANRTTRESMIMAPMIYPTDIMSREKALEWMGAAPTVEVADMLCHSLLRKLPFAGELAVAVADDAKEMTRYVGLRLWLNLLMAGKADVEAVEAAARREQERGCALTRGVCRQIMEEVEFLREE